MVKVPDDASLNVKFGRGGRTTRNISSWSMTSAYTQPTDNFEFVTNDDQVRAELFLPLQPVELSLNGAPQMIGRVDITVVGGNGTEVTCRGRDFIADLTECGIDPTFKVQANETIAAVILRATAVVGIKTVADDADVGMRNILTGRQSGNPPSPGFRSIKTEDMKPDPGEGIYEFLDRFLRRHGATIQPGPNRQTLVLSTPDYDQAPSYELYRSDSVADSKRNNIKTASATRDYSSFPTFIQTKGKAGRTGNKKTDIKCTVDMQEFAFALGNDEIFGVTSNGIFQGRRKPSDGPSGLEAGELYRYMFVKDDVSKNQAELDRSTARRTGEMSKDTLVYECTVNGHVSRDTGAVWAVNTVVKVNDRVLGVNENMWIASRTFTYSQTGGAETRLSCWRLGAFQL